MKYYLLGDEEYIKLTELIDFASKENNNKININGRLYQSLQHGHWEDHAVSIKGVPTEACSVCGEWTYGDCARFCPNCGAIMDEEVEEDGVD